jgi:hypothetical protein
MLVAEAFEDVREVAIQCQRYAPRPIRTSATTASTVSLALLLEDLCGEKAMPIGLGTR